MKCRVVITDERDEVVIYTKEKGELTDKIEALVESYVGELVGTSERGENFVISPTEVTAFTVIDGCVFAILDGGKYRLKERLYELEERLSKSFVKINKSTLANPLMIRSFSTGFGCSLDVVFKNGYKDYVSRRQIKVLKERITRK